MSKLGSFVKWLVLLPILLVVLLLAVSNDQSVPVHLNPFDTSDPMLRLDMPLYQVGFLLFALGAICGAAVAWGNQRRMRRRSAEQREEAAVWQETARRREAKSTALAIGSRHG